MFKTVVCVFKFPVLCVQKLFCVFKNCFAAGFLLTFRIKKKGNRFNCQIRARRKIPKN